MSSYVISSEEFNRRRTLALGYLKAMTKVAFEVGTLYPNTKFQEHIPKLERLKNKLIDASEPNLTDDDIEHVRRFRNGINNHPKFRNKLIQHYHLAIEYAKDAFQTRKMNIDPKIEKALRRYGNVDRLSREIINEIFKRQNIDILALTSLMALLVARKESFDYFIQSIEKEAVKSLNLSGYDIEEMCSIDTKVEHISNAKQGIKYTTDINAMRDCISHGYYTTMKANDGSYNLKLEWIETGRYNFSKTFTATDFFKFIQEYVLFEMLQGILLTIGMSEVLMELGLQKP